MMTIDDRSTEFVVFCIENTAARIDRSGSEVYSELLKLNAIETFLYASYPALHTQSKEYIVDEVLEFIYHRDPTFLPSDYQPWIAPSHTGKEEQA
ncbi:MAG: DUF3791 domain-containing protein [Tannerellaceae bacterium]